MANENDKNNLVRININVPKKILQQVKEYANEMGLNTTAAINILLKRALEQSDVVEKLPELLTLIAELQKKSLEDNKE